MHAAGILPREWGIHMLDMIISLNNIKLHVVADIKVCPDISLFQVLLETAVKIIRVVTL